MIEYRLKRTLILLVVLSCTTFHPTPSAARKPAANSAGSTLFTHGVVVEEVEKDSALEKAGVKPGDLILAWERPYLPSESTKIHRGELRSVFDWFWLDNEQAPQGKVRLLVQRSNKTDTLQIPEGVWHAKVHPVLPARWSMLYSHAIKAIREGRVEEASRLWNRLAAQASIAGISDVAIWVRLEKARAWKKAGNLGQSEIFYKAAISAARKSGLAKAELNAWVEIIDLRISIPRLAQALEASLSAEQIAQRITEGHLLISAMLKARRAQILWLTADLTKAKDLSESSLLTYTKLAPISSQLTSGLNLEGMILDDMGQLREASDFYQKALFITDRLAGRDTLQVPILNNLGIVATARGDFVSAEGFIQQAVFILRAKSERSIRLATLLANLGSLNHTRYDFDKSEIFFKQSLALYNEFAPKSLVASVVRLNLGRLAIDRGDLDAAKNLCADCLRFRESVLPSESLQLTSPLDCLSLVALNRRRFDEARKLESRVLRIAETHAPGSLAMADSLIRLSTITYSQGDLEASEAYAMRAETIYKNLTPETYFHASVLQRMALIRARQGRTAEAGEYFSRSIAALESQVNRAYESEVERGTYKSSRRDIYKNYVIFLLSVGRREQAFAVLERWRAGGFLAMLNERDLVFSDIPQDLESEVRQLAVEYDRTLQKLASSTSTNSQAAIKERDHLLAIRVRQGEVAASIRRVSQKHAALRYPQPLDFESTRQSLDPQTTMLSYSVETNKTYIFVITPGQALKVFTIDLAEREVSEQIQIFRNLLQKTSVEPSSRIAQREALDALSRKLFDELMAPVVPELKDSSHLVIINDGPLHLLPWNALIIGQAQQRPQQERHYLAEWKPIHIALSATVYKELRELPRSQEAEQSASFRLAAFGDPIYPVRISDRAVRGIGEALLWESVKRGLPFDSLPSTRQEVESIALLFGKEAKSYLGSEATEENAKSIPRATRIVHFATHATLDERSPLDSAVVLSIPEKFEEGKDNGLLQAWEIFEQVRLNADLVVLSACECHRYA